MKIADATRPKLIIVPLLAAAFLLAGCDSGDSDSDNGSSNITAQWSGSGTMSYSYSGGVPSGATCSAQFHVTKGSGTFKVTVSFKNPSTGSPKSASVAVSEGDTYKVSAKVNFGGRTSCSSSPKIELDSPSMSSPKTFYAPTDNDPLLGIVCPKLSSVGSVNFTKM